MFRAMLSSVVGSCVLVPAATYAHHSRAAYDMTKEIVIEGTVADLAWKNPHIFMTVETEGQEDGLSRVEVEVTSVSVARALGLPREAVAPGTRVVVRAHPSRYAPDTRAMGLDVKTTDGSVYPLNTVARLAIVPTNVEARSVAGRWAPTLESFNRFIPGFAPAAQSWPLTDAGRAAAADARSRLNSASAAALGICEPFPPPVLSIYPDLRTIEVNGATLVMRFEGGVGLAIERVVHMGLNEHPAGVSPSLMGHSIGRWDGDTLVIDTVAFSPHPLGASFLPSGPNKHLIERLTLVDDGLRLEYTFTLEDPDVFTEPVFYTAIWDHRPDLEFSGEPCDLEVARRPLVE